MILAAESDTTSASHRTAVASDASLALFPVTISPRTPTAATPAAPRNTLTANIAVLSLIAAAPPSLHHERSGTPCQLPDTRSATARPPLDARRAAGIRMRLLPDVAHPSSRG